MKTFLKSIIVFQSGELIKQINYKTKKDTLTNYKGFVKNGILDSNTGEKITNVTFELL